jgi:hypothetical protein
MIDIAEASLAYTMLPYHPKSYAMLDAGQKKTFDDLVQQGAAKK